MSEHFAQRTMLMTFRVRLISVASIAFHHTCRLWIDRHCLITCRMHTLCIGNRLGFPLVVCPRAPSFLWVFHVRHRNLLCRYSLLRFWRSPAPRIPFGADTIECVWRNGGCRASREKTRGKRQMKMKLFTGSMHWLTNDYVYMGIG